MKEGYIWYVHPNNIGTSQTIIQWAIEHGLDTTTHTLNYKGKKIEDLIIVNSEFINYWEKSIRFSGNDWFSVALYSKDKNDIVRKNKFPRKEEKRGALNAIKNIQKRKKARTF